MKVSIITVVFNGAATIKDTIESVINQNYYNIEYIIIDGSSTDGTQEIVKSYGEKISKFISEKDNGLYDAMNKGITAAEGDIVGILNADDLYYNNSIISKVVESMTENNVDILYGDLIFFDTNNPEKIVRYYKGGTFKISKAARGLVPPHPTFFIKKGVYDKFGKFDTKYTLSADFDLIVRFLGVHNVPYYYLPQLMIKMRLGGLSTKNLKNIFLMNKQDIDSCRKNGIKTNFIKFHSKYFYKGLDFIKRKMFKSYA